MTDRENVISLVRRRGYERMPIMYSMTPICAENFKNYCRETGYVLQKDAFCYIPDSKIKTPRTPEFWKSMYDHDFKDGTTFNEYGVANEPGSAACLHMTRMYHPLEEMTEYSELEAYPFPEYLPGPTEEQIQAAEKAHEDGLFVMGGMQCTIWETAWYARGMEVLMMDMMAEPELAELVLDKVTENSRIRAVNFAKAGADGIYLGDDIGMQSTIMMSRELYCTYLKPRLTSIIRAAKAINPELIVFYHSCGYVTPFIDDLIEAGVDVLNPVQPESMNFEEVNREFGDRISFCGTLGTQTLMPFGTPEEIRETVFRYLDLAGRKGGLIACPTHILEPEVPPENVAAYMDACRDYCAQF